MSERTIGFTNGCYDIIHIGHLKLIEYLNKQVDVVIVGIDSDKMIHLSKGPHRPFNKENERKFFLEQIKGITQVFVFDSHPELEQKLSEIKPNLMVVGSDYRNKPVIGSQHAEKLEFFEVLSEYSTTKTAQHLASRG